MRLVTLDIEASPAQVVTWDLKTNGWISPGNILKPRRLLCLAYRVYGDTETQFTSEWTDGHEEMVQRTWHVLDEADGIISYNGQGYDLPMLNTEFILAGLGPPSPYASIDLMKVVKQKARFMSNSLDFVTGQLGIGRKGDPGGMKTWLAVEKGDEKAQERMRLYNELDVELTELAYRKLRPWISNHPSRGIIDAGQGCPICGGSLAPRGYSYTRTGRFRRFCCNDCKAWSRSTRRDEFTEITAA